MFDEAIENRTLAVRPPQLPSAASGGRVICEGAHLGPDEVEMIEEAADVAEEFADSDLWRFLARFKISPTKAFQIFSVGSAIDARQVESLVDFVQIMGLLLGYAVGDTLIEAAKYLLPVYSIGSLGVPEILAEFPGPSTRMLYTIAFCGGGPLLM